MAAVAWDSQTAGPCTPRAGLRLVSPDAVGHPRARRGLPAEVYRRRRVAAVAVAIAAAVAVALAVALVLPAAPSAPGAPSASIAQSAQSTAAGPGAEPVTVVVAPGETLWDLAAPHAPAGTEPMAYVVEVAAYNDVDPRAVRPGTVLQLPRVAD